jgi:hypothetical protein
MNIYQNYLPSCNIFQSKTLSVKKVSCLLILLLVLFSRSTHAVLQPRPQFLPQPIQQPQQAPLNPQIKWSAQAPTQSPAPFAAGQKALPATGAPAPAPAAPTPTTPAQAQQLPKQPALPAPATGAATPAQPAPPAGVVANAVQTKQILEALGVALSTDSPLQKQIKDATAKPLVADKLTIAKEALASIRATTVQADKDAYIGLLGNIFNSQASMKKQELVDMKKLFTTALALPNLFAPNQKPTMEQWISSLDQTIDVADAAMPVLDKIKTTLSTSTTYSDIVKAAQVGLFLTKTNIAKDETLLQNKNGLLSKMRDKIPFLYNNRGNKTPDDLKALKSIFDTAKITPALKDLIVQQWDDAVTVSFTLSQATIKTDTREKLKDYQSIIKLLSSKTDRYEKQLLVDGLTTIFSNRSERAKKELEQFSTLLTTLSSEAIKKNNIFDRTDYENFGDWLKILQGTIVLTSSQQNKSVKDQIAAYQAMINNIAGNKTDYEKGLFITVLSTFFSQRGDLNLSEIEALFKFFTQVQSTPNLLATNQTPIMVGWLKELGYAKAFASSTTSYLDAVLTSAVSGKNLEGYTRALDLISPITPAKTINSFVNGLNALFLNRDKIDKKKCLDFFILIGLKKINTKAVLNAAQDAVLKQWIKTLTAELQTPAQ